MKSLNSIVIISLLLFATVISWTYFSVSNEEQQNTPQVGIGGGPNEPNYDSQFLTLLSEHGSLATTHLTRLYNGEDTFETSQQLEENIHKLARLLQPLGTAADTAIFLEIFRGHVDEYETYTKGLKENNPTAMNLAKENLQMHALDFGKLIHKIMPTISEQRGTELMTEHVNLTLDIITAHAKGDIKKKDIAVKQSTAQIVLFTRELANGAKLASR